MAIKMFKSCGVGDGRSARVGEVLDDLSPETERELIRMGRAEKTSAKKPVKKAAKTEDQS